jgi:hypothetical protein
MGKAQAEDKNVEIYLRIKPVNKASRNATFDLAGGRLFSFPIFLKRRLFECVLCSGVRWLRGPCRLTSIGVFDHTAY